MQVTYRIPSKKVPYGYIELTGDHTEFPVDPTSPDELAEAYAWYIKTYQAAEVAAFEAAPKKPAVKVEDSSTDEAVKMLNDGLGGVEEIDENEPVKPWDKAPEATATEEKKPWSDADWDFS
jgi:hypothetical protein